MQKMRIIMYDELSCFFVNHLSFFMHVLQPFAIFENGYVLPMEDV
jgi:hypothetical protein